jgi:hypothetical protein
MDIVEDLKSYAIQGDINIFFKLLGNCLRLKPKFFIDGDLRRRFYNWSIIIWVEMRTR